MESHIKAYTFKHHEEWETIDTYWNSPFFYWKKHGAKVTPVVPLRIKVLGQVVDESENGWLNIGGTSAMFLQSLQARGRQGQTIRLEVGDEIDEYGDQEDVGDQ